LAGLTDQCGLLSKKKPVPKELTLAPGQSAGPKRKKEKGGKKEKKDRKSEWRKRGF